MLKIDIATQGKVVVIRATGNLDALTAPSLIEAIQTQLTARKYWLLVDLAGVGFASSAGLRALLIGAKAARQVTGDVRIAAVQPGVLKVLQLAGFTQMIQTFDSVPAGCQSFG